MGADVFQCLPVFAVFIAGVVEEGLDGLAVFIFLAICAGDVDLWRDSISSFYIWLGSNPENRSGTPVCSPCSFFQSPGRSYSKRRSSRFPLCHSLGRASFRVIELQKIADAFFDCIERLLIAIFDIDASLSLFAVRKTLC